MYELKAMISHLVNWKQYFATVETTENLTVKRDFVSIKYLKIT